MSNLSAGDLTNVIVTNRVAEELLFNRTLDVEPNTSLACGDQICDGGEEGTWNLGTLAAGEIEIIQVRATVDANLSDGSLIVIPVLVTSNDTHSVSIAATVVIDNP